MKQKNEINHSYWYRELALVKESKAGLRKLAMDINLAISNGTTHAIEGAKVLRCVWDRLDKPEYLSPFVGLASEYDDYSFYLKYRENEDKKRLYSILKNQQECLSDIINYSKSLQSKF